MQYLILGVIFAISLCIIIRYFAKRKLAGRIEQVRSIWINRKLEYFDFINIARYANVTKEKFHRLTSETIIDIDLHELFAFIDRTTSKVGQQILYKKLVEPSDRVKDELEQLIFMFTSNNQLREENQLELLKLNGYNAYFISSLLGDFRLKKPRWFNLLFFNLAIVACLFILSFKFQVLILFLLILFMINMGIHYWNKGNIIQFTKSIPQLNILINVAKKLQKTNTINIDFTVDESISNLRSFQHQSFLINFQNGSNFISELSLIVELFFELIKSFFLVEVIVTFQVIEELRNKQSCINSLLEYVGNIDVAISIAALRKSKLKTCQPNFIESKKELKATFVYHPLIENCIKNSLTISNKSVLITGSNMSGKSTFLRTLLINSILAQTIYTCFADEFTSPILKQFSSIRIDDNLFEGKSYYFQEVNMVASFIERSGSDFQNLFVLDEVFKGTNKIERIAAAKAVLSYLNKGDNLVIVSTHDIDMAELLINEYELYHFSETIENGKLLFDHTIKYGYGSTRNAIKILELAHYPLEVIKEAQMISEKLTQARTSKQL